MPYVAGIVSNITAAVSSSITCSKILRSLNGTCKKPGAIGPKEALYDETDTKNLKDAFLALVGAAPGRVS